MPHELRLVAAAISLITLAGALIASADTSATVALAMAVMPAEPLAYTIREFCRAHGISPPTYYALKKQNLAPAEMRMGAVIRVSREAAAEWRQARENPVASEAIASARTAETLRERARRAAKRAIQSPRHISRSGTRGK